MPSFVTQTTKALPARSLRTSVGFGALGFARCQCADALALEGKRAQAQRHPGDRVRPRRAWSAEQQVRSLVR